MKDKYLCWDCEGGGKIEVCSPEGHFIETCLKCGGTGKRRVTITLEEYETLKQHAEKSRKLTENEELSMGIC